MAGAGQPFYMPLTWPVGHVASAILKDENETPNKPVASPSLDWIGHMTSCFAATRSFLLALFCIYGLYDSSSNSNSDEYMYMYPAFGRAASLQVDWMIPICLRNLLAAWAICGFWDWFLYFSPLAPKLHKYKLNPVYPSRRQFIHDAFMTSTATVMGSILEIIMCHLWATGKVPFQRNLLDTPLQNFLWAITITHWRVPHFWLMHRSMHPWFPLKNKNKHPSGPGPDMYRHIPDVGRFLYRHVHSLHHKSYNPTAFSGTNMHPVESFLYFTAGLVCVPFGCHPAIFLGCVIDCAVGAWLGHDGFQWPGSGDYFHQLHHQYFECNYGAMHFPIDMWLGTFCGGKESNTKKEVERMEAMQEKHEVHPPAAGVGTSMKKD